MAAQPFVGSFSLLFLYTIGRTPWTGDQPVARPLPTHRINAHTDIHASSGIRTDDLSIRESEDRSCLTLRDKCYRRNCYSPITNKLVVLWPSAWRLIFCTVCPCALVRVFVLCVNVWLCELWFVLLLAKSAVPFLCFLEVNYSKIIYEYWIDIQR
jgi:hypothetical protein